MFIKSHPTVLSHVQTFQFFLAMASKIVKYVNRGFDLIKLGSTNDAWQLRTEIFTVLKIDFPLPP